MYAYTQEDGSTKLQVKMENETVLVEYKRKCLIYFKKINLL